MKLRWLLLSLFNVLAIAPTGLAQNVFVTIQAGTPRIIMQVHGKTPMVQIGGKLVEGGGSQYGFARATVYRAGLVSFDRNTAFKTRYWFKPGESAERFAGELNLESHLTTDTTFRHCFMVLDILGGDEKTFAYAELPDLIADQEMPLHLNFPLYRETIEGRIYLHIFSDGAEVLHSRMAPNYLAAQKKKTAEILTGQVRNYPAILAHPFAPAYPEALKKSGIAGSVMVRCHVGAKGDIASAEIVRASDPAFGVAALAAVAKWKFDPAIKNLQFVDTTVEVPIAFAPPK